MATSTPVHVRMVYDYEYTVPFTSAIVSLRAGERFCLQEKVSSNWWRVTRLDQTSAEIIIPALYAEEIRLPALPTANKPNVSSNAVRNAISTASGPPTAPPKPPAKPGKKPVIETMPELDHNIMTELFQILTMNGSSKAETRIKKNKTSSTDSGKTDGKGSKSKHTGSVEDLKRNRRLSSEQMDDAPIRGNDLTSLSGVDGRQKSKTLGRLGGGGAGTVPNAMITFGDYWSDNRDIFRDKTSPIAEYKERYGSVESLDAGFTEDDDSGSSFDGLKHATLENEEESTYSPNNSNNVQPSSPTSVTSGQGLNSSVPIPSAGSVPLKLFTGGYEMYRDELTGRNYYFNRNRGESSWILPRRGVQELPESPSHSATTTYDLDDNSLPQGWTEERDIDGEPMFVHSASKAKWKQSLDEKARVYFYNVDADESAWSLPTFNDDPTSNANQNSVEFNAFSEKAGLIQRSKVAENGKKIRKNWMQSYAVLCRAMLYFYKDQKSGQGKSSVGKPEAEIDLRGAAVNMGNSTRSSRKNVIEVTTATGTEYLLHSEDDAVAQAWYLALFNNLSLVGKKALANPTAATLLKSSLISPASSNAHSMGGAATLVGSAMGGGLDTSFTSTTEEQPSIVLRPQKVDDSPGEQKKFHRRSLRGPKKSSGNATDRPHTPDTSLTSTTALTPASSSSGADKSRGTDKLKFWLSGRPSKDTLRAKGIYKEGDIFGSHLLTISQQEKATVPRFVQGCIEAVELNGLSVDGIYRLSGNMADIQKLRCMVNQNESYNLRDPSLDIHVVTGALKLFFRELLEPLIPFRFYQRFIDCISLPDRSSRVKNIRELIKLLPASNRDTLKEMCRHLSLVMDHSAENRMSMQNIAIVFGPTLMWPEECDMPSLAVSMVQRGQLVELLLHDYQQLFV